MGEYYSAPQPSVTHIVSIFRQIGAGEIQVPAFQRGFVWSEKQVLDLLDSVYGSYPIGSILLWGVASEELRLATSQELPFPAAPKRFPTSYVLDGMQRLSSLYGVFNFGKTTNNQIFEVGFDLHSKEFIHLKDVRVGMLGMDPQIVPLSAIFDPKSLLDVQSKLIVLDGADDYLNTLIDLQSRFQDYMIPVVKILDDNVERVVRVFEKINSSGTPLDTLDFMRAITWTRDFDLSKRLDEVSQEFGLQSFDIDDETVVKIVAMNLNLQPTSEGLLSLRGVAESDLEKAFDKARRDIQIVITFLGKSLDIHSGDLVPYEGQFLILIAALCLDSASPEEQEQLAKWFLLSSLNEVLRGRPDHYVARAVANWRSVLSGQVRGFDSRLRITASDFTERKMIRGRALSSAFLSVYASLKPRDLFTGEPLGWDLSSWDAASGAMKPILKNLGRQNDPLQARIFANMIVSRSHGWDVEDLINRVSELVDLEEYELLNSHFMDSVFVSHLRDEEYQDALNRRAYLILEQAKTLVGVSANNLLL